MKWIKKGVIFNKEFAQLPVVDIYENYYRIYCSTRDNQGRSIPKAIDIHKSLTSSPYGPAFTIIDNINIPLGKPGSFDSHGVMPTEIITLKDGTKHLYYIGWSKRLDVPYWNSIGLAISKDNGITWEKYSEGPIFNTCAKEPGFIGTISIVHTNEGDSYTHWLMYYSSAHWEEIDGKLEPVYDIKSALSKDGINWEPTGETIIKLFNNEGGIASFRKLGSRFYYSIRKKNNYRINPANSYHIKSVDLFMKDEMLELYPGENELMCAYPFIIEEKDKYLMFYNTDFGKKGIYYAYSKK